MRTRSLVIRPVVSFFLLFVFGGQTVQGVLLTLSTHSSEQDPGAELLNATLDFSVVGSVLTLTVDNLTDENAGQDNAFNINKVYFNVSSNITGLDLTGLAGTGDPDITAPLIGTISRVMASATSMCP